MSYNKLANHFASRTPYKYSKTIVFDGTKIVATEEEWVRKPNGQWGREYGTDKIVLAEYIQHNGKDYPVVYNRGNKCFTTEVLAWGCRGWRKHSQNLKYGEIGKPDKDQQRAYRCQMIDALIYGGVVKYLLIPTTLDGDSDFFKLV